MAFNRYGSHTFYFDYELERDGEYLEVEVAYTIEDGDIGLESVRYLDKEMPTTEAEDLELLTHARDRADEDLVDAEADYGDYMHDMRREWED